MAKPLHFSGGFLRQRMDEFGTPDELRGAVSDLIAAARRVGYPDLFEVTAEILFRVESGSLRSTDDIGRLEQLFRVARLDEIGNFLKTSTMTFEELETTVRSRKLIENAQQVTDAMELRAAVGIPYSVTERRALKRLKGALGGKSATDHEEAESATISST